MDEIGEAIANRIRFKFGNAISTSDDLLHSVSEYTVNPSLAKGTKQPPHARQLSQPASPLCAQACTLGMVQSHCHHTPQWTDWSREERRYMAIGQSDPDLRWIREHIRRGGDSMYDFMSPALARGWLAAAGQLEFVRSSAILQALGLCMLRSSRLPASLRAQSGLHAGPRQTARLQT